MKRSSLSEIGKWALLSGLLVFAFGAARVGWTGQDLPTKNGAVQREVDGVRYAFKITPNGNTKAVTVVIEAASIDGQAKTLDLRVESVDRTFVGSPMSRTIGPNDYKEALVAKDSAIVKTSSKGLTTRKFTLKYNPFVASEVPNKMTPSPNVKVLVDDKPIFICSLVDPQTPAIRFPEGSANGGARLAK